MEIIIVTTWIKNMDHTRLNKIEKNNEIEKE